MDKRNDLKEESIKMKAKICLLGDGTVGKTSIIGRYVKNTFSENYLPTIGTRTSKKSIIVNDLEYQQDISLDFIIWDIMGQVSFRKILHSAYLTGAKGAVMVCDLTRRETFENLDYWIYSLLEEWQLIPMIFVANKNDLKDSTEIKIRELESLASTYESPFFTTSAKSGDNIEDLFKTLGKEIIRDSEETNKSLFNNQIGTMAE
jgi:small GTP-binding protein